MQEGGGKVCQQTSESSYLKPQAGDRERTWRMGTQESPQAELGLCLRGFDEAGLCVRERSVWNEWDPVSLALGLGKQCELGTQSRHQVYLARSKTSALLSTFLGDVTSEASGVFVPLSSP